MTNQNGNSVSVAPACQNREKRELPTPIAYEEVTLTEEGAEILRKAKEEAAAEPVQQPRKVPLKK